MSELEAQRKRRDKIKQLAAQLPPMDSATAAAIARSLEADALSRVRHPQAG